MASLPLTRCSPGRSWLGAPSILQWTDLLERHGSRSLRRLHSEGLPMAVRPPEVVAQVRLSHPQTERMLAAAAVSPGGFGAASHMERGLPDPAGALMRLLLPSFLAGLICWTA